ncbi:MAG: hypothetical protein JO030_09095 [Candidatus Eremiobacteraeota bacterium]|nr:hypothetical protein [Candidatus Eremiobacteraeota bacterium]
MQTRLVADSNHAALRACAWALEAALRYAGATAVVALVIATVANAALAERFATAAFVAASAAAGIAAVRWFLSPAPVAPRARPSFPAAFAFALVVALLVLAAAAAASQSVAEVRLLALCFGVIGVAAVARSGVFSALGRRLSAADSHTLSVRYCVIVALCALTAAASFTGGVADAFAKVAYTACVVAAALVAASLLAPLRAGAMARAAYAETRRLLAAPAAPRVFARAAWYCGATMVAGLVLASLLPAQYGERFATAAYLAALVAALAIAMCARVRHSDDEDDGVPQEQWPRIAAIVAGWLVAGAALASSAPAETLLMLAALYAIVATIKRTALATPRA